METNRLIDYQVTTGTFSAVKKQKKSNFESTRRSIIQSATILMTELSFFVIFLTKNTQNLLIPTPTVQILWFSLSSVMVTEYLYCHGSVYSFVSLLFSILQLKLMIIFIIDSSVDYFLDYLISCLVQKMRISVS